MSQIFTATQMEILTELVNQAGYLGAKRAREEAGVSDPTITLAQIRKKHGSAVALNARMSPKIKWIPKSWTSPKSGLYCRLAEFDNFLFNKDFSFYASKL